MTLKPGDMLLKIHLCLLRNTLDCKISLLILLFLIVIISQYCFYCNIDQIKASLGENLL